MLKAFQKTAATILFTSLSLIAWSQNRDENWPMHKFIESDTAADEMPWKEYFKSGNLYAQGPLVKYNTHQVSQDNQAIVKTIYRRTGQWTVYYDSTISTIRSKGKYLDGMKNGEWEIFDHSGVLTAKYFFVDDIIKTHIDIDASGRGENIIERDDLAIFVMLYPTLLMLFWTIPLMIIRPITNIITWNKIYKTKHVPMMSHLSNGGMDVHLYAVLIFWWLIKDDDSVRVARQKWIANVVCVTSLVTLAIYLTLIFLSGK